MDEVCLELGAFSQGEAIREIAGGVTLILPFAIIAMTEQRKVSAGKKTRRRGLKDAGNRMIKTGISLGVGAAVTAATGPLIGLPVSLGLRGTMERIKSKRFLNRRIADRTKRLRELHKLAQEQQGFLHEEALLEADVPKRLLP